MCKRKRSGGRKNKNSAYTTSDSPTSRTTQTTGTDPKSSGSSSSSGCTSSVKSTSCSSSSGSRQSSCESQTTCVQVSRSSDTDVSTCKKFRIYDDNNEYGDDYCCYKRSAKRQTSDFATLMHLLRGAIGSGILAVPYAFKHAGLWFGLYATLAVCFLCAYCIHMLVDCAHILSYRNGCPKLHYGDIAEQAMDEGPRKFQGHGKKFKFIVNFFLATDLLCCCCIYLVFTARNVKQTTDHYFDWNWDVRIWISIFVVSMLCMSLMKDLKSHVPFSIVANIMLFIGLLITSYYIFTDLPSTSSVPAVAPASDWPMFFGIVIFAAECVGVVMVLENDMRYPNHFTGCPSVLCIGMGIVIVLYTFVGFFGYLKYGDSIEASITLNLPVDEPLAQSVKLMIGLAIFFTFNIQFYVPLNIIWDILKCRIPRRRQTLGNYALRVVLVLLCGLMAIALPHLGPLIALVGAVCLSVIGLMAPAIIELLVYYECPGYGFLYWRFIKNLLLISIGLIGLFSGSYKSLNEIVVTRVSPSAKIIDDDDNNNWMILNDDDETFNDFWKRSNKQLFPMAP